jgi:hypothetical protein
MVKCIILEMAYEGGHWIEPMGYSEDGDEHYSCSKQMLHCKVRYEFPTDNLMFL